MKRFYIIAMVFSILLAINSCSSHDSKETKSGIEDTSQNVEEIKSSTENTEKKSNVNNQKEEDSSSLGTIVCLCFTLFIVLGLYHYRQIVVSKIYSKLIFPNKKKNGDFIIGPKDRPESGSDNSSDRSEPKPDLIPEPKPKPNPIPEPKPAPIPEPKPNQTPEPKLSAPQFSAFAEDAGEWSIIGASVQGNGHISMGLPCQDSCGYEFLGNGWGIAVTADGAGSAKNSQTGSAIAVKRSIFYFKNHINNERWQIENKFPTDIQWLKGSYKCLKSVHDDIRAFSQKNNIDFKSLSSTIIVVIHSPLGLLTCHIGDGRAGYKDKEGNWHSLMTPHKGEEANQTIFIPSEFWNIPLYEMSGVLVPESRIINEKVTAFVLMSDGCENTSWLCNQYNDNTGKYFDPNLPHKPFFNNILTTLNSFREEKMPLDERKEKWVSFITNGNKSFIKEIDDKTMIVGTLMS